MQSVGIKAPEESKNRLSEYVRAAAAGETVLVTDPGRAGHTARRLADRANRGRRSVGKALDVRLALAAEVADVAPSDPDRVADAARLPRQFLELRVHDHALL
jgi:antitoxin (DNA-binding transcriptional repressor) of toxin-antitoxin stability system